MIKVESIDVYGFKAAIHGMRNPLNSWDKSDSFICKVNDDIHVCHHCPNSKIGCPVTGDKDVFIIGNNDLDLMKRLVKAGTEHRKYLRMIHVTMDITAPLYWWKEFDTYKVGTTANSCSTMHKLTAKEFTIDDFSFEHLHPDDYTYLINSMNSLRDSYLHHEQFIDDCTKMGCKPEEIPSKRDLWYQMIQLLPSSYNQRRTVDLNYETVFNIIHQRYNHKLDEWVQLVEILNDLPYVREIQG